MGETRTGSKEGMPDVTSNSDHNTVVIVGGGAAGIPASCETRLAAREKTVRPTVFIHTNHKQITGAVVAEHSMRRNSNNADKFDVRIIHTED
jgi:thioredoxin reductase